MKNTPFKKRILFVCSGNSCRSQMAEGWARTLGGDQIDVLSAGVEAHGIDSVAIAVMSEVGIDISKQRSKSLGVLPNLSFDCVVTLSERAADHLRRLGLPWPVVNLPCESPVPRVIGAPPSLAHYRRVRDVLHVTVSHLLNRWVRHAS
ncbi:MAG TPA: arsenate reductase ArsC [Kiritimatiellia bacterium]|nr:arsenate reductase ArsC [Kiritimatiellia bacterium]HPS08660.1 arsenate reductase ArsC [Kiritimatiellia bacterium]